MRVFSLLILAGCDPKVLETGETGETGTTDTADTTETGETETGDTETGDTTDTETGEDTDTAGPPGEWEVVATTTDYTTGALITIDAVGNVHDSVLPVSSDAAVRAIQGSLYVLNRSSENTVQVFEDGKYAAPRLEFSTGDGSNPQDIANCGASLFVSLYSTDSLGVYDVKSGLLTGTVDLSAYADADGSPEASGMEVAPNGYLYVALNQLDYYTPTYESDDGSGTLVKVDCVSRTVVDSWDVGPNPRIDVHPSNPTVLLLTGGNYYNDDYSGPELDGGVWWFDTANDALSGPLLTEADVGFNIGGLAGFGGNMAMTTFDDGYTWRTVCMDLDQWTYTVAADENMYVGSMAATPDGKVWVGQAVGFGSGVPPIGFVAYDPVACTAEAPRQTTLAPSSLTARVY